MTVTGPSTPLYDRLPAVYRERDLEQTPPQPLRALLDAVDSVMRAIAERVDAQYDDLFIETCDDWLIPYIADLVGTSHLKGDPWTLRADVARTVHHRRRKGTLGAVESQVHALSQWAVHAVELRDRLAWMQPLNHLRPDVGGGSPFAVKALADPRHPVRGGTVALRSPAWLSFARPDAVAFDPWARTVDLKPPLLRSDPPVARAAANLPNLGVFVWRLADVQTPVSRPSPPHPRVAAPDWAQIEPAAPGAPLYAVRFELHPQGEPMVLFDTHRYRADDEPPNLAHIDAVPGPMLTARLTSGDPAGRPQAHVEVRTYAGAAPPLPEDDAVGLLLHLPQLPFGGIGWTFRGADLCAWELGLSPPLAPFEIVIDPQHGRVVFGVTGADATDFAEPLRDGLRVSATTAAPGLKRRDGGIGALPLPRTPPPLPAGAVLIRVDGAAVTLADALADLPTRTAPLVIEITNSDTHRLDLAAVAGIGNDAGVLSLRLPPPFPGAGAGAGDETTRPWPLTIRAASGQRPVVRLVQPLRFRPAAVLGVPAASHAVQNVRLQGLYLTRDAAFPAASALVEQAALNRLQVDGCTLDPGGGLRLDGTRSGGREPLRSSLRLHADLGLTPAEAADFGQTPQIVLDHCIAGAIEVDRGHRLGLVACIVDAGSGVDDAAPVLAISSATADPERRWAAPLAFDGITVFGRTRVEVARGAGGIFVHRLQVHDNQDSHTGAEFARRGTRDSDVLALLARPGSCIRESWFAGVGDRLPQHHGCLVGTQSRLVFGDHRFGRPAYAQLSLAADRRIADEGPDADEMGAYGFLANSHRWKNVGIRLREFMPVGVRALLVPVT